MKKKVEIIIEYDNYDPSVQEGCRYTSVQYGCCSYGGAAPCDTAEDVKRAVARAQESIRKAGDIPVIVNKIEEKTLNRWF